MTGLHTIAPSPEVQARFWAHIQKTSTCWLWTGSLDTDGYGQLSRPGLSPIKVHRLAWILAHGPIGAGVHILHKCDVRNCVRATHLFEGDQDANMKDAAAKGRLGGARPSARTLSAEAECELLAVFAQFTHRRLPNGLRAQLARRYGVSPQYISLLGRGGRVRPSEARA